MTVTCTGRGVTPECLSLPGGVSAFCHQDGNRGNPLGGGKVGFGSGSQRPQLLVRLPQAPAWRRTAAELEWGWGTGQEGTWPSRTHPGTCSQPGPTPACPAPNHQWENLPMRSAASGPGLYPRPREHGCAGDRASAPWASVHAAGPVHTWVCGEGLPPSLGVGWG